MRLRFGAIGFAIFFSVVAAQQHSQKSSAPTFYKNILPILQEHCQSCHRAGEVAPMPLMTYEQTRPFASTIAQDVQMKMMPPWFADPHYGHFANDASLTEQQIAAITAWAAASAPEGNPHDAPPPKSWIQGWNIAQPDAVVKMPKPVPIPANGEVDYTYEIVPTHFTEDKWVQMSEMRPSSSAHVHHAVVYIRPPDSQWLRHAPVGEPFTANTLSDPRERREAHETTSDLLLVYAPGSSPDQWPDGMAKFVPAGSDIVFQMHYTTNGTAGHRSNQRRAGVCKDRTKTARHHFAAEQPRAYDSAGSAAISASRCKARFPTMQLYLVCFRTCICAENVLNTTSFTTMGSVEPLSARELSLSLAVELSPCGTARVEGGHKTARRRLV